MNKLHPLILTPEKKEILISKMLYSFLWLPDEVRASHEIEVFVDYLFSGTRSAFWEIGNFDGIVGFYDILPEYKCVFLARLWHRSAWSHSLVREIKDLALKFRADQRMRRISLATPDERLGKLARLIGFRAEGTQKNAFRFERKLYTQFLYRLI